MIVSGVDVSDPDNPLVIVTDPGTGQVAASYPLDAFLDAWEDSGFSMIATTQAPEQFGMDHLAWIGEVPYDQFASWYPSAADMTGHESGFDALCSRFANLLHNPLAPGLTAFATVMTGQEVLPDPGSDGQPPPIGDLADSETDSDDAT